MLEKIRMKIIYNRNIREFSMMNIFYLSNT